MNKNYIEILTEIRKKHQNTIDELFNNQDTEQVHAFVIEKLDYLKSILDSVFILKDLSDKSLAKIRKYWRNFILFYHY